MKHFKKKYFVKFLKLKKNMQKKNLLFFILNGKKITQNKIINVIIIIYFYFKTFFRKINNIDFTYL